jgi:hypothetical protein
MMPFVAALFARNSTVGSVVLHTRVPAGDMQSGSDRRIPAGDMNSGSDVRRAQETI